MDGDRLRYTDDVPDDVEARLRAIAMAFPEAHEQKAWAGVRWMVRTKSFAHVLGIERKNDAPLVVLAFRADGEELEVLRSAGHPFFILGWGRNAVGMVLDDDVDWDEVQELLTESYCVLAPKRLAAQVERP